MPSSNAFSRTLSAPTKMLSMLGINLPVLVASSSMLEEATKTGKLMPSIESILVGADRVREKALLEGMKVANSAHRIVTHLEQLDECIEISMHSSSCSR